MTSSGCAPPTVMMMALITPVRSLPFTQWMSAGTPSAATERSTVPMSGYSST